MNILLDFITLSVKTGAGEYCRRVYFELIETLNKNENDDVNLFALYDSSKGIAYDDMRDDALKRRHWVAFVDCKRKKITDIVEENKIDSFFIGCAQYVGVYEEIARLKCEVIAVVHDNYAEELTEDSVYDYFLHANGGYEYKKRFKYEILNFMRYFRLTLKLCKTIIKNRHNGGYEKLLSKMRPIMQLFADNKNMRIVTVSEFSKSAIIYHYEIGDEKRISVMYSPERNPVESNSVESVELRSILDSKRPYILMLSANREAKNAYKTINAFKRFCKFNKDLIFVAVGRKGETSSRILNLPFLSDQDLTIALRKCYALIYPSFFEGFGYPPLEAMRYGKPVLCSNVSSLPEVLGNAPIYFSPFYNTDIFRAMMKLVQSDDEYAKRSELSLTQYKIVHERQERDLRKLLDLILKKE